MTHADLTWFPTCVFMEFMLPKSFGWSEDIFHETEHFPKLSTWFEHCISIKQFVQVRQELVDVFRVQYQQGRLSGVKEDVKNHPQYKWKYM